MNLQFFQWRSLKTRVTLFTLLIFVISTWSIALYVSRMLCEDMQTVLGGQQFSNVSGIAREIDGRLSDREQALQTIAKEVTPNLNFLSLLSDQSEFGGFCMLAEPPLMFRLTVARQGDSF